MTMTSEKTTTLTVDRRRTSHSHLLIRGVAAALALGIAYVHVKDQGGFPGDKSPTYMAIGYYLLETAGLFTAIALLVTKRHVRNVWLLAVGIALGPLVGFVVSRGPGLPFYTEDRGNWTEPLAVVSVVVEAALLVIAAVMVGRSRRSSD